MKVVDLTRSQTKPSAVDGELVAYGASFPAYYVYLLPIFFLFALSEGS